VQTAEEHRNPVALLARERAQLAGAVVPDLRLHDARLAMGD
jgi:hypothetical protein